MLTQEKSLIRKRLAISERNHNYIIINKRTVINFCSNDYLSMGSNARVKKAFIQGIEQYGAGSGSSALVSGFYKPHQRLEEKFAEFLQRDKAILFSSGYLANLGVIRTLVNRDEKILADKFCHSSLLEGIQLSRAHCLRYAHNDLQHVRHIIAQPEKYHLWVTESVFSMEGDVSPIDQMAQLAKQHDILFMVDDAHGAGVLGSQGRGITEYYSLTQQEVPCLIVPLGKAFASLGAIVAGPHDLIECITQFAKTYCYSTALPPAVAHAALTTLKIIEREVWRRQTLQALIQFFIAEAKQRNLHLTSNDITPIKSILIGDNTVTLKIKNELLKKGFFISCIRPPTVLPGTARIRVSLNCMHNEKDIVRLLDLIVMAYEKFKS